MNMAWSTSFLPWCPASWGIAAASAAATPVGAHKLAPRIVGLTAQKGRQALGARGKGSITLFLCISTRKLETGGKAHWAFICSHCLAWRSDAVGRVCYQHLLVFSSHLRLCDDQSLPWALLCHPLTYLASVAVTAFPEQRQDGGAK